MNQTILMDSNSGYRELSFNIINELIDGSFASEAESSKDIPGRDELNLFFSRLQEGRGVGPFYPRVAIPDIDKIYSEKGVPTGSTKFLIYFLKKLGVVINATHNVELQVQEFISSCNRYLSSPAEAGFDDFSTERSALRSMDGKALYLNRRNLAVHVESIPGGRRISMDALSSGEKQMISLFAKLFLYPGKKIVLIDEPELSLSLDWQRNILVDVLNAPSCCQIIAITHSPFVFDNDLEPFAKSMALAIDLDAQPQSADESVADE